MIIISVKKITEKEEEEKFVENNIIVLRKEQLKKIYTPILFSSLDKIVSIIIFIYYLHFFFRFHIFKAMKVNLIIFNYYSNKLLDNSNEIEEEGKKEGKINYLIILLLF